MTAPVLLICFNRPDLTQRVLSAVAAAQPKQLFLACDGPREGILSDETLVAQTREILSTGIDWPCDVLRLYATANQGCRRGVQAAVDWFFGHVEEGIILEDDCLPHPEFFEYATEMLARFRENDSVMHISGDGSHGYPRTFVRSSYVFSREVGVWGWATWRRAWVRNDARLETWSNIRENEREIVRVFGRGSPKFFWQNMLDRILLTGLPDTWDYQWAFSVRYCDGVAVVPIKNLIQNIGFREDATHTRSTAEGAQCEPILPLLHPKRVKVFAMRDRHYGNRLRGLTLRKSLRKNWRRIRQQLRVLYAPS